MVLNGLDILLQNPGPLKKRNVALIANQTSVTLNLKYSWLELRKKDINLKVIFSPEHGLFSTEQDQVAVTEQPGIDCNVISLYGDSASSLLPDESLLQNIDLVIFDIQDIGSRYYTYSNTLALFMEAVSGLDIEVLVLDRPNPLNGITVEGPLPDPAYRSFVGILPVPPRHSLTAGELALLYLDQNKLDVNLRILSMKGWERSMHFPDTGLHWIGPSPNMPTWQTALVYPGMCLFEGLNVSEGRGTTTPFLHFGAPFIEPDVLSTYLASIGIEGVLFRPAYFKPSFHKYTGEVSGAMFLHVTDPVTFAAFMTGIAITAALHELYPDQLEFLREVYEFNDRFPAFDLLCGSSRLRTMIENNTPLAEIRASWADDEQEFLSIKQNYHLYH
ncbi:MAG: DUF1343 domain-containing protein [Chlorobium phaeobacteroides]|uniref:DUF1343 domain-containing protein n=1 Tax=Chlorobium phaeobacteroides (strain BS1) TaxID=331678 RepID=B3EL04_CHLPB|nr:DUF1343 domain-containing protein [Chlorobium phaeobacteroides]MBL6955309.1 DUF1343 domain-containing protein [Chlorobium phaeobacteroides]NEX13439.1 DUF1343 domain-containing protein [Prosthecochloris sp.]